MEKNSSFQVLFDEFQGVIDPFADPPGGDSQPLGHLLPGQFLIIIEVKDLPELRFEPLDGLGDPGGPFLGLDRLFGVRERSRLGGVPQDLGLLPDVVDDPAARDGIDERPYGGFPPEFPVPDLLDDLGDDLVGHVLPVRRGPPQGLPDAEGHDGPELEDKLVQIDGGTGSVTAVL